MLAWHLVHGPQDRRIADATPPQAEQELHTADIVVARRLLGHAESPPPRPYPKTEIRPVYAETATQARPEAEPTRLPRVGHAGNDALFVIRRIGNVLIEESPVGSSRCLNFAPGGLLAWLRQ
jgi:hypothetical protein